MPARVAQHARPHVLLYKDRNACAKGASIHPRGVNTLFYGLQGTGRLQSSCTSFQVHEMPLRATPPREMRYMLPSAGASESETIANHHRSRRRHCTMICSRASSWVAACGFQCIRLSSLYLFHANRKPHKTHHDFASHSLCRHVFPNFPSSDCYLQWSRCIVAEPLAAGQLFESCMILHPPACKFAWGSQARVPGLMNLSRLIRFLHSIPTGYLVRSSFITFCITKKN